MKVLWAPWRMEYILSDQKREGCIFCPGEDRSQDEERLILHVGSLSMVMMNRYPYINGHLLVAPVRHVSDLDGLSQDETLDLLLTVRKALGVLRKAMAPEGFNIGLNLGRVAGAGVEEHVHFHIVPRWNGDTNSMTVLGEVRVIPEHIKETYGKLLPFFREPNPANPESGGEI
ncbi:MAG: HIT family hydrolase [Deltaproteobacteria bacterium]|nr:MAG: HIT family hydrolase [Deltaproteobacteria bacterium]